MKPLQGKRRAQRLAALLAVRQLPAVRVYLKVRGSMPRGLAKAWLLWGSLLCAIGSAHCAYIPPDSCALRCAPQNLECPEGFECQAGSNRCVRVGMSQMCVGSERGPAVENVPLTPMEPAPDEPPLDSVAVPGSTDPQQQPPGKPPAEPPLSASSPVVLAAVDTADAFSAETRKATVAFCTDEQLTFHWHASGGAQPYTWDVKAPAGLSRQDQGSELTLSGTALAAGSIEVMVSDANGQEATLREEVYQRPRVLTSELRSVCPEEIYSQSLTASGGEPATYQWSAQPTGALASTVSLTELGLSVVAAQLSGVFVAPEGAAPITLGMQVSDAHCTSHEVTLSLDVLPAGTAACPRLRVWDFASRELPSPCRGAQYQETLWLEGGPDDARIERVSGPNWLAFDPEQRLLSGTAGEAGALIVRALTADRTLQHRFAVAPREKCWFGWVDATTATARLELVDALRLAHRPIELQPSDARRSYPRESAESAVTDFKFSPDGRSLAYRLAEAGGSRLVLLDLLTQRERPLFTQVSGYSWSPSSNALAALTGTDETPRLELASTAPGADAAWVTQPPVELSGSARSLPVWFGAGGLALLEADPALPIVRPAQLQLELGAASYVRLNEAYQPTTQLRGGPGGFFLVAPYVRFYAPGRDRVEHDEVVLSPSGRFVGRAREGYLRVLHDYQSAADAVASDGATTGGCAALLAWAQERERIACFSEETQQLAIYDLEGGEADRLRLSHVGNIDGPYLYSMEVAVGRRRVFSRTGQWLAFSTRQGVYVANLDVGSTAQLTPALRAVPLASVTPAPDSAPPELLFSTDERTLLVQAGDSVRLLDLASASDQLLATGIEPAPPCSEDLMDVVGGWCGTPTLSPQLAWAMDSQLVLTRTQTGVLRLHDASQDAAPLNLDPGCGVACPEDSHGFQP